MQDRPSRGSRPKDSSGPVKGSPPITSRQPGTLPSPSGPEAIEQIKSEILMRIRAGLGGPGGIGPSALYEKGDTHSKYTKE